MASRILKVQKMVNSFIKRSHSSLSKEVFSASKAILGWEQTPFIIDKVGKFNVVRDDLLIGGTKVRILIDVLNELDEEEIVYSADHYGYGQLALAVTCEILNKKCKLVTKRPQVVTEVMRKVLNNTRAQYLFLDNFESQKDIELTCRKISEARNSIVLPVGFDFPLFNIKAAEMFKSFPLEPEQVWTLSGSGTLCRAMIRAWPNSDIRCVSLGFPHANTGNAVVYHSKQASWEKANNPPPYPSCLEYDAKLWDYVQKLGSEGSFIWNVA